MREAREIREGTEDRGVTEKASVIIRKVCEFTMHQEHNIKKAAIHKEKERV